MSPRPSKREIADRVDRAGQGVPPTRESRVTDEEQRAFQALLMIRFDVSDEPLDSPDYEPVEAPTGDRPYEEALERLDEEHRATLRASTLFGPEGTISLLESPFARDIASERGEEP